MNTAKRIILCAAALIALSGWAFSASSSDDTTEGSMGSGSESSTEGSTGTDSGSGGSTGSTDYDSGTSSGTTDSGSSPGGSTGTDSDDIIYDLDDSMQSSPGSAMGTYSSSHKKSKKGHDSDKKKKW